MSANAISYGCDINSSQIKCVRFIQTTVHCMCQSEEKGLQTSIFITSEPAKTTRVIRVSNLSRLQFTVGIEFSSNQLAGLVWMPCYAIS